MSFRWTIHRTTARSDPRRFGYNMPELDLHCALPSFHCFLHPPSFSVSLWRASSHCNAAPSRIFSLSLTRTAETSHEAVNTSSESSERSSSLFGASRGFAPDFHQNDRMDARKRLEPHSPHKACLESANVCHGPSAWLGLPPSAVTLDPGVSA